MGGAVGQTPKDASPAAAAMEAGRETAMGAETARETSTRHMALAGREGGRRTTTTTEEVTGTVAAVGMLFVVIGACWDLITLEGFSRINYKYISTPRIFHDQGTCLSSAVLRSRSRFLLVGAGVKVRLRLHLR